MPEVASMQERIAFFRRQAVAFNKIGDLCGDRELARQFRVLADSCKEIADNIERNLPIHVDAHAQ